MVAGGWEQRLLDAVRDGEVLDLATGAAVDATDVRSWDGSATIPASVIRDLVLGRREIEADPHGLRLRGARIAGRLDLAHITSTVRVELIDCFVPDGVDLRDSRLPGLVLDGSRFGHPAGSSDPPVDATRLVAPTTTLRRAVVHADTPAGAVRLVGAHLGELACDGAQLDNASGPALHADGLCVDRAVFLRDGFRAVGGVQLVDAHVGLLDCGGARLENASGPALCADGLRVDRAVFLRAGFRAVGAGYAVLCLNGAAVGGSLWLDTAEVTRPAPGALVDVEELTYGDLPELIGLSRWLDLLREHTPRYVAQPYQQLAAVHRAAGHDRDVRTILMAQRRDQIGRGGLRRAERAWARFTGLVLGFGYQPWRALLLLIGVLAVSLTTAVVLGGPGGGLGHTATATAASTPCSSVEQIGVGLDLGLPVLRTGARDRCVPTRTGAGQTLTVAGWVLQLTAWALATLFVAGFTGAVRRT